MIFQFLRENGPSRSSLIVAALEQTGIPAATARQQVARVRPPIRRFPVDLLPRREAFVYLEEQRSTERFWSNLMRDMRETGSVYGAATDALLARGGVVSIEQFGAMSSGTVAPKRGQVSSKSILDTLKAAQIVSDEEYEGYGKCVYICQSYLESPDWKGLKGRQRIELLMLDALREWAKKLGLASYNLVAIRGESALRPVGPYGFDLTGPSYLLPLRKAQLQPGFFVADVVAEGILNEHQVRYFLRKVQSLKISLTAGVFPILLAEGFTGEALTAGHKAGAVFATYKDLFGSRVGNALHILLTVLKNAAAHAAADPEKIAVLLDSLTDIEGSAGNLRGILFELAYSGQRDR